MHASYYSVTFIVSIYKRNTNNEEVFCCTCTMREKLVHDMKSYTVEKKLIPALLEDFATLYTVTGTHHFMGKNPT